MGGFSLGVVIASMVGAGCAAVLNIRASIKLTTWAGSPWMRLAFIVSALQAVVYFVAYWWLLNHPTQGEDWSTTLRPVGALSWIIGPWAFFALGYEAHLKRRAREMKAQAAKVLKEVRDDISHSDDS